MDPRKNVYKQYNMLGLHTPISSTKWAGRVTQDTRGRKIHDMPKHTVEGGEYFSDNMSTVAEDNAVSLEQLKAANPQIIHEDRLSPGQRLNIPHSTKAPQVYKDWIPTRGKKTPSPQGVADPRKNRKALGDFLNKMLLPPGVAGPGPEKLQKVREILMKNTRVKVGVTKREAKFGN